MKTIYVERFDSETLEMMTEIARKNGGRFTYSQQKEICNCGIIRPSMTAGIFGGDYEGDIIGTWIECPKCAKFQDNI